MPRYILAVDPGLKTGLAMFEWTEGEEPILLDSYEATFESFAPILRELYARYPTLESVCERFLITAATAKNAQAPYSLEEIGVMKQVMLDFGHPIESLILQSTDAKTKWPNPSLKKLGYWHVGGGGHALDAIRHGLTYMNKKGWVASRLLS